jgi:hypothetical protein
VEQALSPVHAQPGATGRRQVETIDMPMIPFALKFPELGAQETRTVQVTGLRALPDGSYDFLELYCDEPGCDCRRVMISVLREDTGMRKIWATISYGWETVEYYRKWGGVFKDPAEIKGPYLDPLNPQSEHAHALLDLFRHVLRSPQYVARLKRHYRMFRAAVEEEHGRARLRLTDRPKRPRGRRS